MRPHLDLPAVIENPEPAPAEALLATIAALSAIMVEENEVLASGYPAGLGISAQRKTELAADYAELWQDLEAELTGLLSDDPGFGRRLMAAVSQLRLVAGENIARLEAAMSASRRRVESILAALRDEARGSATYGGRGDVPLDLRLPPFGTDFHA